MANITIDLRNYKSETSARVPEGTYLAQLDDIYEKESQAKNPMLVASFTIVGGEEDGQTLVDRLTLTDAAMFRVVAFLNGFGIKTPKKKLSFDPNRLIGRKVQVEVVDNEYNGRTTSQIAAYIRVPSSAQVETEEEGDDLEAVEAAAEKVERAKAQRSVAPAEVEDEVVHDDGLDLDDIEL